MSLDVQAITGVRPGDTIPAWEIAAVDRARMKILAPILADPNPIHFEVDVVRQLGMGDRPVNQGPNNMAYVMNMLAAWSGEHARLRKLRVRFSGNVFGDDHVVASGTVTEVRIDGDRALADCDVRLVLATGETALSGSAVVDVTGVPAA